MVTCSKMGDSHKRLVLSIEGLTTDVKPLNSTGGIEGYSIENGSTYQELNPITGELNIYIFDAEHDNWVKI